MKYVSLPWPPVVAARGCKRHRGTAQQRKLLTPAKSLFIPSIQLCPSDTTIPFKLYRRRYAKNEIDAHAHAHVCVVNDELLLPILKVFAQRICLLSASRNASCFTSMRSCRTVCRSHQ
jgi:hypothetical protein